MITSEMAKKITANLVKKHINKISRHIALEAKQYKYSTEYKIGLEDSNIATIAIVEAVKKNGFKCSVKTGKLTISW